MIDSERSFLLNTGENLSISGSFLENQSLKRPSEPNCFGIHPLCRRKRDRKFYFSLHHFSFGILADELPDTDHTKTHVTTLKQILCNYWISNGIKNVQDALFVAMFHLIRNRYLVKQYILLLMNQGYTHAYKIWDTWGIRLPFRLTVIWPIW